MTDFNQHRDVDAEFLTAEEVESHLKNFVLAGEKMPKAPGESEWKDPEVVHAKYRGKVGL